MSGRRSTRQMDPRDGSHDGGMGGWNALVVIDVTSFYATLSMPLLMSARRCQLPVGMTIYLCLEMAITLPRSRGLSSNAIPRKCLLVNW